MPRRIDCAPQRRHPDQFRYMGRHALLIGLSEFRDKRLARLNAPVNDVTKLQSILQDKSRGGFDSVELSLNEDFLAIRDRLARFFQDRVPDDLLLLYYSGHGILGRGNRLFLATAGSNLDAPRGRSVSAQEIRDFMGDCRAERQIVVLDCCHSGAFADHSKAAVPPPAVTPETFSSGDAGLYVLTAADALQFAWDGAELRVGDEAATELSKFTSWLVDGLDKGEAAPDDEQITMDALYRYLCRRARSEGAASTPQRFVQAGVGDLVISANPLAGSSRIDPEIITALAATDYRTRLGAVTELTLQMGDGEGGTAVARAARVVLQHHFQHERDYVVRQAVNRALADDEKRRAEAAPQAEEEKRRVEAARQAEEEKRQAEAPQQTEEQKQRAETARRTSGPPVDIFSNVESGRTQMALSVTGLVLAVLAWLAFLLGEAYSEAGDAAVLLVVALVPSATFFAIRSEQKRVAHVLGVLNPFLTICAVLNPLLGGSAIWIFVTALLEKPTCIEPYFFSWCYHDEIFLGILALYASAFMIESAAVFWSRRSPHTRSKSVRSVTGRPCR